MIEPDDLRAHPLAHLGYFTEWGGAAWRAMVRLGVTEFLGPTLDGLHVLEIGSRHGRMSCLFGLMGAQVLGIDRYQSFVESAQEEARRLGVTSRVQFARTAGDFQDLPTGTYDIVFTKSVLVTFPDLQKALANINRLLNPGGRVLFIENGLGGTSLQLMRWIKHRGRNGYSMINYFTSDRIETIRNKFDIDRVEYSSLPPVYLICGHKLPAAEEESLPLSEHLAAAASR
jgi:SAM-dependent methyltransferase